MRHGKKWVLLALVLAIAMVSGCATLGVGNAPGKKFVDMSPMERSLYFMATYKAQYADAAAMGALAQQGKLSVGQVQVYRVKRELLIKAKPLIEAYDVIVAGGGVPSADREQEILDLINRLTTAGSGGAK